MSDPAPTASGPGKESIAAQILSQLDTIKFNPLRAATFSIFPFLYIGILLVISGYTKPILWLSLFTLLTAAALGSAIEIGMNYFRRRHWQTRARNLAGEFSTKELREALASDFFTNLVHINFKYLDQYYREIHEQAAKSFRFSVAAATISLMIILAGIFLLYKGEEYAGGLAAVAGVLGQFLSGSFFFLYSKANLKMSEYHEKLVFTQNIALGMKIADDLKGKTRDDVLAKISVELVKDVNNLIGNREPKS